MTKRGIDVFRIGGVQIAIDVSWIFIFVLVLWSLSAGYFPRAQPGYGWLTYLWVGLAGSILFFASVVVHELSHAIVANRSGQNVQRITLFIFGGMAHLSREPEDARTELEIAAVGPLTSLALGGVFWLLAGVVSGEHAPGLLAAMFSHLAFVNVALAVFNLLPGFPLDGGRILRAVLWMRWGDLRRATASAARSGSGIGIGLIVLGGFQIFSGALVGGLWLIFIGMFLRGAAESGYEALVVDQMLGRAPVRDLMIREPIVIPADLTVRQAIEDNFLRHGFGGFPVAQNGGAIEGLVSLKEIKGCSPEERDERRVRDVMVPADERVTIDVGASVGDALNRMVANDVGRLLVVDETRPVGLITRTGIARFVRFKNALGAAEEPAAA